MTASPLRRSKNIPHCSLRCTMGGGLNIGDDWELASSATAISTLVLVGTAGNGKSATGNSILGRKVFKSHSGPRGVTGMCEMQSTILDDGRTVNVIDTPGLFDYSYGSETSVVVGKEIVRCLDLAKDGIHAVLLVFSARRRFTNEDEGAFRSLLTFFGDKITDHVILVFTSGDDLEDDDLTLKDFISQSVEPLQNILQLCKGRVVLFENKTKDKIKQAKQLRELLSHVDSVVATNNGKPFSDDFIAELKEGALRTLDQVKNVESLKDFKGYTEEHISELKKEIYKSHNDQLARITEMVEQRLQQSVERLEKQLADEQAAREAAVNSAHEAHQRSAEEIRELRKSLEKAKEESEEFRRRAAEHKCAIL